MKLGRAALWSVGAMVSLLILAGCGSGGSDGTGMQSGRQLFADNCGTCHVLAAADTKGTAGPDLDDMKPSESRTLKSIEKGGTGSGQMPADLVSGKDAEAVAEFVAASAGSK